MITIATQACTRSSATSDTSALVTSSLSASGSINLPKFDSLLARRASQPSSASVKLARMNTPAASASLENSDSISATSTGTSRIRKTVRTFGTLSSNNQGFNRLPVANSQALQATVTAAIAAVTSSDSATETS